MSFVIKICGITRPEDAVLACREGATAIGINFWPRSKRFVDEARARAILAVVPAGVLKVGVFVDPTAVELVEVVRASGVRTVQLHGDEPPELCAASPVPVVKGIRVRDSHSLAQLATYEVSAFLLDSATPGYGGSGTAFDWALAEEAARTMPIWLAGGLGPDNVAEAVRRVRPRGVDVASGVEAAPGVKDPARMEAFIRAAKGAWG